MELTAAAMERARLARDRRFDGRFFVAVRTTGVFCRPICPVPLPRAENVVFYPSAAAAAEAGFRPCLRCRPESAPGTPAWQGAGATVSRALRLIDEGALDAVALPELAARLGVGSRHLSRLFQRHLGVSPGAVARTRRLLFAKQLLDETRAPLTEVALASGFGSVRRFNAAIQQTYRRTPSELRARRKAGSAAPVLRLSFRGPLPFETTLSYLRARAVAGVEHVSAERYVRTFALGAVQGTVEITRADAHALALRITPAAPSVLLALVARARRAFDLDASPDDVTRGLADDPALAWRLARLPGVRVPGGWDVFETAVRAIVGQRVSVAAATTVLGRIVAAHGEPFEANDESSLVRLFPGPNRLRAAELERCGLTRVQAEAIRALAAAVEDGALDLALASPEALTALPGVGPWTAQYVAMRGQGDPDALPAGDLVLQRAAGVPGAAALVAAAERWRPWRAYAAMLLWLVPEPEESTPTRMNR